MTCSTFLLTGYVRVHISGCSCERFLNLCVNHNISLWQIIPVSDGIDALMFPKDFLKIKRLVKKCQVHVSIRKKYGFPFFLRQHRKRRLLLLGWIWCCFFIFLLSRHIWKIEITGNREITRETMLSYLSDQNIRYGCSRDSIDCREIAADIRNVFPSVTWVSVKKTGTLLKIDLKENTDKYLSSETDSKHLENSGYSLISKYDGVVVSIITRSGIPAVEAGDTVKKGDLLVSGIIPVTNDENEVIRSYEVQADADITLQISETYTDRFSRSEERMVYLEPSTKIWYLKLFRHRFLSGTLPACDDNMDMISGEVQLSLFSDFYLPVSLGKISVRSYKWQTCLLSESSSREKAASRLEKFLVEKEEKGVQILKKNVRIDTDMTFCRCICTYEAYVTDTGHIPAMQMEDNKEGTFS